MKWEWNMKNGFADLNLEFDFFIGIGKSMEYQESLEYQMHEDILSQSSSSSKYAKNLFWLPVITWF